MIITIAKLLHSDYDNNLCHRRPENFLMVERMGRQRFGYEAIYVRAMLIFFSIRFFPSYNE
jgi:hypothetical protein